MKTTYQKNKRYGIRALLASAFLFAAVLVKAQCLANFTYTIGPNGSVSFASTSTGTSSTSNYSWNFGTPATVYGPTASYTFGSNGAKIVCLTLADTLVPPGCTSTKCDTILINNVLTTTSTPCNASFGYTIGANGVVHFMSTSTGTTSNTYTWWNFGSVFANGASSTQTYTSSGPKSVCIWIVDSVAGCSDQYCDTINVTIGGGNPCNPSVMYTLSKDSTQAFTWFAWVSYPPNTIGVTWSWGDGSTSNGMYPSHTYSAAGTYSTCVTVTATCNNAITTATASYCYVASIFKSSSGESNDMISVNVRQAGTVGIKENKTNDRLNIYPNPNSGSFVLDLPEAGNDKEVQVYVYNVLGELVFVKNVEAGQQKIDASALTNGTYFVKIISDKNVHSTKVSVQK